MKYNCDKFIIKEIKHKNIEALQLENHIIKIIVIPSLGGKIASFYRKDKDFELLYENKYEKYIKPNLYDFFEKYDASGFDDAFPTIDTCKVKYGEEEIIYPDHGEIWTGNFNYQIVEDKIILTYTSKILDYSYEKKTYIEDDKLIINYKIINKGKYNLPCIWAMHCLVKCEEDMEIIFPKGCSKILNVHDSEYLGTIGKVHSYPKTISCKGDIYYLNRVFPKSYNKTEKYYVKGELQEGKCGIYYPSKKILYSIDFPKEKLPYLGFWVTEGGFRGDYNCALEPTNGYYDDIDIAKNNNKLKILEPKEELNFYIRLQLKSI
ncbi:DUF5107 domain-containing protein [Clostridium cochlearium]|uniref:DUF5107 domain-containing protein n=1 Tax=Clostridium cochlearium TaxID=1494 RepID=A0A7Y3XZA6_CLOCO|nr:DUF5107 domain-containing protein [Clostridium cochlearium]NOH16629.1 DUF5107 domain-containing protein [Clostridium cochlearium]